MCVVVLPVCIYVCGCFTYLYVCVPCASSANRSQKSPLDLILDLIILFLGTEPDPLQEQPSLQPA